MPNDIYDKIWTMAVDKLSRRPLSRAMLLDKLEAKFPYDRGVILRVLDELERVMLLNDKQFTEQYLNHLMQKNIGRFKIMLECKRKGLDQHLVEELLLQLGYDEIESAKKALEPKLKTVNEADPRRRKHKLMNFLRNRGFKDAVIYKVI